MQTPFFRKKESDLIKGIAIIMMFIHHLFGFSGWILKGNMYCATELFGLSLEKEFGIFCKICVGLYVFISGYAMYIQEEKYKKFRYVLKKILEFLISYWIIYAFFLVLGLLIREPLPSLELIIKQCFGVATGTGFGLGFKATGFHPVFAWYVSFYLLFMLTFPLLSKLSMFNYVIDSILYFLLLNGMYIVLFEKGILVEKTLVQNILIRYAMWACVGMQGYLFAKYRIFELLDRLIEKLRRKVLMAVLCIGILALIVWHRYHMGLTISHSVTMDVVYTPLLIFALVKLLKLVHINWIDKVLMILATYSLNMWFLHGMFFANTKNLQWIAYAPKYPILILIWTMVLMLLLSIPFSMLQKWMLKPLNRK